MYKLCTYRGESETGPTVIPLFNKASDAYFEKTASATLLPDVVKYIESLRPRNDAAYNLVNAMGAGEFFGSNVNGDHFPEAALIHRPDDWTGNPLLDKIKAKDWAYGYPTFYSAHPYAHHRNKDAGRAFGEVELAVWHPRLKRVELVTRVDKLKCQEYGGTQVWDKLSQGMFPDVSMGCKVPFDTCSICLDWKRYHEAAATFDPKKHASPGQAILAIHKKTPIRGVSITRKDYCEHARNQMNKILADGRKVYVYNDFPKFFDISFVFIGADKTAKTMMKIASEGRVYSFGSSAYEAEKLGYDEMTVGEKTASLNESIFKEAFQYKDAKLKKSEIIKDIVPSQFAGKAVATLSREEEDLPDDVLDALGKHDLPSSLSTSGGLGIVLRPREFQRIVLIQIGRRDMADDFDRRNIVFPRSKDTESMSLGHASFLPSLARLLLPLMESRSALAPAIEHRVLVMKKSDGGEKRASSSHPSEVLRKIGAAYNGYRTTLMDLVSGAQGLLNASAPRGSEFSKLASAPVDQLFTPLTVHYLRDAFWDELGADIYGGLL